eukprot:TRINITY_DN7462_c0_g1_i2.p2 TRINITY_DN7462_c0_g1~~TRINITY_DN7462_c0_g1_i2.p2  ORF type:complete len:562 (+),score=38.65 TRINITY_DN7462_c0_g1_i2:117-1802(+)
MLGAWQPSSFRSKNYNDKFGIPTLQETIDQLLEANKTVGIYIVLQEPSWYDSLELVQSKQQTLASIVMGILEDNNYQGAINSEEWSNQPIFIQSSNITYLRNMSSITELPLVFQMSTEEFNEDVTTDELLDDLATFASAISMHKDRLIPINEQGQPLPSTGLAARIESRGMMAFPYTFRNELQFIAFGWQLDPYIEYAAFIEFEPIRGLFTDYPYTLNRYLTKGREYFQRNGLPIGPNDVIVKMTPFQGQKKPFPRDRPENCGHRGAYGILPEHTPEVFQLAIDQGADYIECDIVLTKDLIPICRYEVNLEPSTDVADKFPNLKQPVKSTDLTLEQIKTLTAIQTDQARDPNFDFEYKIASMEDYIDIALAQDRVIGIYPEIKKPRWHDSLSIVKNANTTISDIVIDLLRRKGYKGDINSESWAAQPVIIQSLEYFHMKELSTKTELPLSFVFGGWGANYKTPDNKKSFEEMTSDESLDDLATFISAGWIWKSRLLGQKGAELASKLHQRGIRVDGAPFRNDPKGFDMDLRQEFDTLINNTNMDGLFTDFPASLTAYLNEV